MKIVVTGGAGFIASHIVDAYISLGHQVVVIDNLSSGNKRFLNSQAQFFQIDVRDKAKINEIFTKIKPEILSHHAAQMDVRKSVANPMFDADVNIMGLINLLEAGRKNSLKKVIFASSGGAVYGDATQTPTPETYPASPASPYGVSKLSSEYYLNFYFLAYGISFIALRYGNVYGPRQNPHGEAGVVAIFTKKLLNNDQPVINGDGLQSRDFVYVEDVVHANNAALSKEGNLIANIGTSKATSINEICDTLVKLTQKSFPQLHADPKPGEQRLSLLDVTKAKQNLGWSAQVLLTEGLARTIDFFTHET